MALGDLLDEDLATASLAAHFDLTLGADANPTAGDLLIAYAAVRSDLDCVWSVLPDAGWVGLTSRDTGVAGNNGSVLMAYKIAEGDEGQTYHFEIDASNRSRLKLIRLEGPLAYVNSYSTEHTSSTTSHTTAPADPGTPETAVIVAAGIKATGNATAITHDAAWTLVETGRTDGAFGPQSIMERRTIDDPATTYSATWTHTPGGAGPWASIIIAFEGGVPPVEPPEPDTPPHVLPVASGPLIEIYVSGDDSFRWGEAQWGEAQWGTSGWEDVTPEGVTIDVQWGTFDAERGILAKPEAGVWTINTYDPERLLDPTNESSPFYPEIVPGLPIRISHRQRVLRTGMVESVDYEYEDHVGRIRATDAAAKAQAIVPMSSPLGDTVYDRIEDAIAAADVDIELVRDKYDATVAPEPSDELSVWDHALNVAEERPRVLWVDRDNRLRLRRWGTLPNRGHRLTGANLVNLRVSIDDNSRYSVVRTFESDGTTEVERAETPTPRYGRRVYERGRATADADTWASMVLADRATPGVAYRPGDVACFTADDVEYFGQIEGGEIVEIDTDEIGGIEGVVLGGRFRVIHRGGDLAVWRFNFAVHQTGFTGLVDDDTGLPLVDDDDTDSYLIAD